MFTLIFSEEEWIFFKVIKLVHETMLSHLLVMVLQEKDLSQSLW